METILHFLSPTKTSTLDKLAGVRRYAAVLNWHVQSTVGLPTKKELAGLVRFWNPIGIIVECGVYKEIKTSLFAGTPTVYLDLDPRTLPPDAPCVNIDSYAAGRLAARELLMVGHPNFAFVPYPLHRFWSDDRERGFQEALATNGKTYATFGLGKNDTLQNIAWQRRLRRWIAQVPKPCSIFAANDTVAAEVLAAAAQCGFGIPREIAVCGVDNLTPICECTSPSLTSIQPDCLLAGELAARTLSDIVQGKRLSTSRLMYGPSGVVRRASTRVTRRYDPEVTAALEFIRRRACEGISSGDVVNTFTCSRRMAELRFREALGRSILDEIHSERLKKAKEMLSNTSMGLAAIANFCGFKAAAALWKFFRKETGVSPTMWRRGIHT